MQQEPRPTGNWSFYRAVIDGEQLLIDGLNIWDHSWRSLNQYIDVKDPIYQQDHVMTVYEISEGQKAIRFAAGEFSNLVWGIYLQQ